jgi:hypothetical protein
LPTLIVASSHQFDDRNFHACIVAEKMNLDDFLALKGDRTDYFHGELFSFETEFEDHDRIGNGVGSEFEIKMGRCEKFKRFVNVRFYVYPHISSLALYFEASR